LQEGSRSWLAAGIVRPGLTAAWIVLASCGGADRCSADNQKSWLRSWTNDLYLWYREVPNVDPAAYATPIDYFNVLKTSAITPSGKPKDYYHFAMSTADWLAFSQSGVEVGYGIDWFRVAPDPSVPNPPRKIVVSQTEPVSPAAQQAVGRGAQVLSVDNVDVAYGPRAQLIAGMYPSTANEAHTFSILDNGAASPRTVTLTSTTITRTPVQKVGLIAGTTVGYMLFNDHIATAEGALVSAVSQLKSAGATDLVIDIRYNGGGYLAIASELAYMIAGPTPTAGRTFERLVFNDKYPSQNPITGGSLVPTPFYNQTLGFSATPPARQPLPSLDFSKVFLLTGPGTCSASESIINSLQGVNVTVIQIGSSTCGKPYGFYPQDSCGTTYFSIQFQGVNDKGFGDYADGFVPAVSGPSGLPGCQVADDFAHALGDPAEARLAAALGYRTNQTCPPATRAPASQLTASAPDAGDELVIITSPWRQNRILTR
jgi:C-terminal processing protease CtpA/Prc